MKRFSLIIVATFAGSPSIAEEFNGELLHSESCTGCHDSSVYTRENRRVKNLAGLGTQVRFCKDNLGVAWFDDEVDDVIGYLNKTYYHY